MAATGVGAGDLVVAAVGGSRYGFAIVWAAVAGAALKFALNEGLARWELASGTTLLEGWATHCGRWFQYLFGFYLALWSFVVGAALIAACGLAAHALVPALGVEAWGIIHSLVAAAVVVTGGYAPFERLVKLFIGVMVVTLLGCALMAGRPLESLARSVTEAGVPAGAGPLVLGVMGGVGGSVTLLSYGYWMRERGWRGPEMLRLVRLDLAVAYGLTGLFGVSVIVLAARVLHEGGIQVSGKQGVLQMAAMLGETAGPPGRWAFLLGFWGAVATSMLGVWQGVPYLFCDFVALARRLEGRRREAVVRPGSLWYRGWLLWLAGPPLVLLGHAQPFAVIVAYAVTGALFMPFLAGSLLYLNSRVDLVGQRQRNGRLAVCALLVCLALFAWLAGNELWSVLAG